MNKKDHREPTEQELAHAIKNTILKPRHKTTPKWENKQPTKQELSQRFRLEKRRK